MRLLPRASATPYTVKKASRNSDVDNGGANQTTWRSENSYSHVVWFCATVVSIGVWRIPTWLFYSVRATITHCLLIIMQMHHGKSITCIGKKSYNSYSVDTPNSV
jgi:hypothetical protein